MNGPRNMVLVGDALKRLRELPDASVDCVITSPAYFQLRSYGMAGQYGLEPTIGEWVDQLRAVAAELARVLSPTGTMWINLGDSYSRHADSGAEAKSLLLGPERLAVALTADGWRLRNKIVWAKTNPMPSSVADRLSCAWEVVYLFVRSTAYYFDLDAIRVPHRSEPRRPSGRSATYLPPGWRGPLAHDHGGLGKLKSSGRVGHRLGKNPGDVWQLATAGFRGAHFATFPPAIVRIPLLAGCPERVCRRCRSPRQLRRLGQLALAGASRSNCGCDAGSVPGLVLDPFFGAGTVGLVAEEHGREWLGIELNPDIAALAEQRIAANRQEEAPSMAA